MHNFAVTLSFTSCSDHKTVHSVRLFSSVSDDRHEA